MMNDRINILAEQAGFYVSESRLEILAPDSTTDNVTEALREFAELIIKECVGVCTKENWKTLGESFVGLKQFDRGVITGRKSMSYDLCDKIEEHFGIK